jgi:hypothetical protein
VVPQGVVRESAFVAEGGRGGGEWEAQSSSDCVREGSRRDGVEAKSGGVW